MHPNPLDYSPTMANLNRPRIVSADKLTEAELDEAIARAPRPVRVPLQPARPPVMDYLPAWYEDAHRIADERQPEAGHCASEIVDDDDPPPMTRRDRRARAVLALAYLGAIAATVYLIWFR